MATRLRPIAHEDRLSIVDHLDELRSRLVICGIALAIAFAGCFWQNHALLNVLNRALPLSPKTSANHLSGLTDDSVKAARSFAALAHDLSGLSASRSQSRRDRGLFGAAAAHAQAAAKSLPQSIPQRLPITIGIGEPFATTLTVSFYFAVLLAFPLLLWQAYAFVLPAFSPRERRIALPLMAMAPVLFAAGVLFGYFLVLPAAIGFLQTFNTGEFDVLVQARSLYTFSLLTLVTMGVLFQLPVGVLALTRLGVVKPEQLRRHWRYAVVIIAVVAVLLPGTDPVTTTIEMVPMLVLYGLSILLASWAERYDRRSAEHDQDADADPD